MTAYQRIVAKIGCVLPQKLQTLWFHPAGPTTIFFWAPAVKWGLVIAGIGDMNRPPENISLTQTGSLAVTGAVWSRYSMVIIPKNWVLFGVNIVVFLTNSHNLTRGILYKMKEDEITK